MFLFNKKNYFYLYIFFLILVFIFNEFSTNKVLAKNYSVSNVQIEEIYDLNFDKSKVIDSAFKKSFKILIYKIVEKKDRSKLDNIPLKEIKSLIENFSITDEKFINKNYKSKFEVQFNKKKILKFLEKKGVISSLPKKVEIFILPLLIEAKTSNLIYLNENIFLKNWKSETQEYFLLNYVLPNEDIEDFLIIKRNMDDIENYNFEEIIKKYNLDSHIILLMLYDKNQIKIFSKIKFDNKNMLINKIYKGKDIKDLKFVQDIILDLKDIYEDKWKSINKLNTTIAFPIRLMLNSKNIDLSKQLESSLSELDLVSDFTIERFDNKKIIYKIIYNSSPDKFLESMLTYNFKIDTSKKIWILK